jgi:hypothetical protein
MAVSNPDLELLQQGQQNEETENPQDDKSITDKEDQPKDENDDNETDEFLKELCKLAEDEDQDLRWRLIRLWKRNDYYFNNIQKIYFDETARDYRTIGSALAELNQSNVSDDIKTINIYRAIIESLVAALAVEPPNTDFPPENAEDPDDLQTSEAYGRIGEIVASANEAPLKVIKTLITLMNCGVVVGYNYYKTDPDFGVYHKATKFQQKEVKLSDIRCPECSELIDSGIQGEVQPETSEINCQNCGYIGKPNVYITPDFVDEAIEWEDTPKGQAGFDIFGPNYFKLPLYARNQEQCGYARLAIEQHIALLRKVYNDPDLQDGGQDITMYERWGRIPPEYFGQMPRNLATVRYYFFRPWYYYTLEDAPNSDQNKAEKLLAKYPEGVMVAMVGEDLVDVQQQKFDECLTISYDPRANFVHAEALGNAIIPIQDSKNDIFNLGLMSIEFGIPESFADPKTLNIQKYNETPAQPGSIKPAKPPSPDKGLADGFFTLKTATLSNEYIEFDKGLDGLGQFISGAFPSIYGGGMDTGSKTATEYTESRSRALQRLQITWQIFSAFWKKMIGKCVIDFAKNLREDTQYAKKQNGTYINVWVKKSELTGKVGHVNIEVETQLPLSWSQQRDFIMNLLNIQLPQLQMILLHPNNTELLKRTSGMKDLYIPGENDRDKQFSEYYMMAQGQQVQIDLDVDDHQVHMLVLKNILVSPVGVALYQNEPQNYELCIQHYRSHEQANQAKTAEPASGTGQNQPPPTAKQSDEG